MHRVSDASQALRVELFPFRLCHAYLCLFDLSFLLRLHSRVSDENLFRVKTSSKPILLRPLQNLFKTSYGLYRGKMVVSPAWDHDVQVVVLNRATRLGG